MSISGDVLEVGILGVGLFVGIKAIQAASVKIPGVAANGCLSTANIPVIGGILGGNYGANCAPGGGVGGTGLPSSAFPPARALPGNPNPSAMVKEAIQWLGNPQTVVLYDPGSNVLRQDVSLYPFQPGDQFRNPGSSQIWTYVGGTGFDSNGTSGSLQSWGGIA